MKWFIIFACSVCFGDPTSLMSKGAMAGVLFLLVVILAILVSIGITAFVWTKRARKLSRPL